MDGGQDQVKHNSQQTCIREDTHHREPVVWSRLELEDFQLLEPQQTLFFKMEKLV